MKATDFGCTAFCLANPADAGGRVLMGRNYDFKSNTSAMMVHCGRTGGSRDASQAYERNIHGECI